MRGLVALAKKIPSKLVDAGIIWQVLPMILVPLIAQEGSPNEEKDPTENSDPFDAVALMAMQCLSLLAQREKNHHLRRDGLDSMNPSRIGALDVLLTPGVVSILRRLSPRQALSASTA